MKPESRLRLAIERPIRTTVHCEKMNNPYRGGTADSWYSGDKADIWVEWKWEPQLPKKIIVPNLSELQKRWLSGRHAEGRRVFVVVGSPDGCVIFGSPREWESGLPRDGAQVLSKMQVTDWIRGNVLKAASARTGGVGRKAGVHRRVLLRADVERGTDKP